MKKAHIILARLLIQDAIKKMLIHHAGLSFLSGFVGSLISIVLSPIVAFMIAGGTLAVDFKKIDFDTDDDGEEFKKTFFELNKTYVSEEQKAAKLKQLKAITKRHLSAKQYLR